MFGITNDHSKKHTFFLLDVFLCTRPFNLSFCTRIPNWKVPTFTIAIKKTTCREFRANLTTIQAEVLDQPFGAYEICE